MWFPLLSEVPPKIMYPCFTGLALYQGQKCDQIIIFKKTTCIIILRNIYSLRKRLALFLHWFCCINLLNPTSGCYSTVCFVDLTTSRFGKNNTDKNRLNLELDVISTAVIFKRSMKWENHCSSLDLRSNMSGKKRYDLLKQTGHS